jgi:hypothetical protein
MKKVIANTQGGAFWKKIKEAKEKGLTAEEFDRIIEIEAMISELEDKLEECREEIKRIKRKAKGRRKREQNGN